MPPRLSRKCTPHLPLVFVKALSDAPFMQDYTSAVYTEAFHRRRLRIVDRADYTVSADDYIDPRPLYGEGASIETKRPALHQAAVNADPLAVCELIRYADTAYYACCILTVLDMKTARNCQLQGRHRRYCSSGRC